MRWLVLIVGIPVAAGLVAVSMLMNYRFGIRLGAEEGDVWAYGLASVCADGLKVLLPFVCGWAWARRKVVEWFAASVLWVVLTCYALVSALSFAAVNRAEITGRRAAESAVHADLRTELNRKREQRTSLDAARPIETISGELRAAEQSARWSQSRQCTDAMGRDTRSFCDGYFRLTAELGSARKLEAIDHEIAELRTKLDRLPQTAGHRTLDPQVELFKDLSGLAEGKIKLALAILVCLLVELGSGLGLYLVLSYHRALSPRSGDTPEYDHTMPVSRPLFVIGTAADEAWARERIERDAKGRVGAAELYADYRLWIDRQGRENAMTVTAFGRWLGDLGVAKNKLGGRIVYEGIRLRRPLELLAAPSA